MRSPSTAAERADSRRAGNVVLSAYLLVTLPVAAVAAVRGSTAAWVVAALHALAVVIAVRAIRRHPGEAGWLRELRDWLPLLAIPALYAELPVLIGAVGTPFQDARVVRWEGALFGNPAQTLASRWPSLVVSELLHLGYLSYYPLIYLPALLLRVRERWAAFDATVLAVATACAVCFATFVVFPVQGPRYLWPSPAGIPAGPLREFTLTLLGAGSSRGAAFPSSHAAVAFAHLVAALRLQPRMGVVATLSGVGIAVGAVYGGFHYAVDMAAGILVGVAAAAVALRRHPPGA